MQSFLEKCSDFLGDPDRETMHGCEFKNRDEELIPARNKQTWISRHLWWYQQSPWLPSDPIIHSFWLSGLLPWKCNPSLFPRFGPLINSSSSCKRAAFFPWQKNHFSSLDFHTLDNELFDLKGLGDPKSKSKLRCLIFCQTLIQHRLSHKHGRNHSQNMESKWRKCSGTARLSREVS